MVTDKKKGFADSLNNIKHFDFSFFFFLVFFFCLFFVFFFSSKQKKVLLEQLTPASPSPHSSPEGDSGTTQILKSGIGLTGATAAVISTGKRKRKKIITFLV